MSGIGDCRLQVSRICLRKRFAGFFIASLGFLSSLILHLSSFSQDVPTITISKGDRINLTLSPLTGGEGAAATKTLQNDLTLSGFFVLGGANATYTARGTASGGSLQGLVVDHGGGTVLSKPIAAAREGTRTTSRTTLSRR